MRLLRNSTIDRESAWAGKHQTRRGQP